jgi:hypothetical protein
MNKRVMLQNPQTRLSNYFITIPLRGGILT